MNHIEYILGKRCIFWEQSTKQVEDNCFQYFTCFNSSSRAMERKYEIENSERPKKVWTFAQVAKQQTKKEKTLQIAKPQTRDNHAETEF